MWISDLYEKDGRLLVRYTVCNHGASHTASTLPWCTSWTECALPSRCTVFENLQLGEEQTAKLKVKQETPVRVLDGQSQTARIAPGEEVVGVVALRGGVKHKPDNSALAVSQLQSIGDALSEAQQTQIAAFLVR